MPVGLMEKPPQKMNERVPKFEGRDELESLMASPNSSDWIQIRYFCFLPTFIKLKINFAFMVEVSIQNNY